MSFIRGEFMYFDKIPAHEQRFKDTLRDSNNTQYTEEVITENGFTFNRIRPVEFDDYYKKEESKKDMIVVHLTEGYLKGDLATLCKSGDTVCVNFTIAKNGTVYELIDQKYWGWHLGRGAVGGNKIGSKRSFSIELSNAGVLKRDGDFLYDYNQKYCSLDDTKEYIKLDVPFRGEEYFASFTDEQYDALSGLISYLCNKYDIPKTYLPENKRFEVFSDKNEARSFSGICTHVNFRDDGKWDIGPAFDWSRYAPTKKRVFEPTAPVQDDDEDKEAHDASKETVIELDEVAVVDEPKVGQKIPGSVPTKKPKKAKTPTGIFGMLLDIINSLLGRNSL